MSKDQRRVRAREITRLQNERRQANREGRSSEEIVVDIEKAVRKGVRASMARTIRTAPPTEMTSAALAELVSGNSADVQATVPELTDLTAGAEPEWSAEREKLAGILATPAHLTRLTERHGLWGRFLIWLNLLAIRLRLRSRRQQKALPKAVAQ